MAASAAALPLLPHNAAAAGAGGALAAGVTAEAGARPRRAAAPAQGAAGVVAEAGADCGGASAPAQGAAGVVAEAEAEVGCGRAAAPALAVTLPMPLHCMGEAAAGALPARVQASQPQTLRVQAPHWEQQQGLPQQRQRQLATPAGPVKTVVVVWRHVTLPRGNALTQGDNLAELALLVVVSSQSAQHRAPQRPWLAQAAREMLGGKS